MNSKSIHQLTNSPTRQFSSMPLEDFVDEEEIGEERAKMDRGVEVVDELRADRRLGEDELQRGLRVARVAIDDCDEREIRRRGLEAETFRESRQKLAEAGQRRVAAVEVLAGLPAGVAALIGGETLGGVREHELVRLLDGVDPRR